MLKHYLHLAWLNFRSSPLASSINILTLSLGLVCFILALGIAVYWGNAERHFENAGRTVVITTERQLVAEGSESSGTALPLSPHPLATYLHTDFPQIEAVARVALLSEATPVRIDERTVHMRGFAADAQFLDIFDLPFSQGDSRTALSNPRSMILTKEAAQILFGETTAVGRTITLFENIDATVTGVIEAIAEPSHMGNSAAAPLQFDLLTSRDIYDALMRTLAGGQDIAQRPEDWFVLQNTTYALLPGDGSFTADNLREELPAFAKRRIPESQRRLANFSFDVVPVRDLLRIAVRDTLLPQQSTASVPLLLLVLGTVVLAVACINFANLATAKVATHTKEVGLRKAIGAQPAQIITQHLVEASTLTAAAMIVALVLVDSLIPVVRNATGIDLRVLLSVYIAGRGVVTLLLLGMGVTLAAGFYPAFVLSRLQAASALRGGPAHNGSRRFTTILVAVQFALAAFLLISLTVVYQQNQVLKQAEREIAGDSLLVIENTPAITGLQNEILQRELIRLPQVRSATTMQSVPWSNYPPGRMMLASSPSTSAIEQSAAVYAVGYNFFSTFGIDLIAGRLFDPQRIDDLAATRPGHLGIQSLIISNSLAERLGYTPASAIVGEMVYMPTSVTSEAVARPFNIIGVVEDRSLSIVSRNDSGPKVYLCIPESRFHVVRLSTQNVTETLEAVDSLWSQLVPNSTPDRRFVSEYFNEGYASFARLTQGFTGLAFIAWIISAIGLYAMAILIANQRIREIAIRKTLGASQSQIVLMLLKDFSLPVLLANLLAWPFAYVAGKTYLNVFNESIPLTFTPFAIALAVSLLIAWATVGGHAWRAANTAPQKVMRYE